MKLLKFKIHSLVDVITNSSTVIFTYQNDSIKPAKDLVNEMLKLSNIDKTADDIFYFGVFCEDDIYLDSNKIPKELQNEYDWNNERDNYTKRTEEIQLKFDEMKLQIMKGEIYQPEWMSQCEENYDIWAPDSNLHIIVRDEKYKTLADKLKTFLNSPTSDGGRDG